MTLCCELNKPNAQVEWKKDSKVIKQSKKHKLHREGSTSELVIRDLVADDAGNYSCICGDQQTTAAVTVTGNVFFSFVECLWRYHVKKF